MASTNLILVEVMIARRWETVKDLEDVENEIRRLPGFERFGLPPTLQEMISLASQGPIVLFKVTIIRSDAILVTESGVRAVPLSSLKHQDLEEKLKRIKGVESVPSQIVLEHKGDTNNWSIVNLCSIPLNRRIPCCIRWRWRRWILWAKGRWVGVEEI